MQDWNVWQWLIIVCLLIMIIVPTIIQIYSYSKDGIVIKHKWWYFIGIWLSLALVIGLLSIVWWLTSK